VTTIDMRRRLDLPAREGGRGNMAVGIEHRGESYGLLIDSVGEVLKIPAASREPNPVNLDPRWLLVADGVVQLDGRLMVVLDVDRVLELKTLELAA
jgi:purine-binding chemotaxis protein CheW